MPKNICISFTLNSFKYLYKKYTCVLLNTCKPLHYYYSWIEPEAHFKLCSAATSIKKKPMASVKSIRSTLIWSQIWAAFKKVNVRIYL